jgi:hypothetical protein
MSSYRSTHAPPSPIKFVKRPFHTLGPVTVRDCDSSSLTLHAHTTHTPSDHMTMSIKTALYVPVTTEFILLSNGEPDYTAHTLWRLGVLHIYRPGDWPNILVSVDPHGERTDWSFQTPSSHPLPPHPWISYDEVTYGLADTEIVPFDIWRRGDRREPHPIHWEEFDRPVLACLPRTPLGPTPPRPSAPPASPAAAVAPSGRLPLPPHIQRIVIDAAIASGATCPVTMESITTETAVITPCGHVFGTELTPRVSLCPVCRASLL